MLNENYSYELYSLAEENYKNSDFSEIHELEDEMKLIRKKNKILQDARLKKNVNINTKLFNNSKRVITDPKDVATGSLPIKKGNDFTRKRKR